MKGKSGHLFWPMLVLLLLSAAVQQVFPSLAGVMANLVSSDSFGIVAIAVPLIVDGAILLGWVILLVIYGIKSQVKLFKILFIVMAICQLFDFLSDFQFHNFLLNIMANQYEGMGMSQVFNSIGKVFYILSNLAWIACGAIILFRQKTGGLLRIAALMLVLYHLYISVYVIASPALFDILNTKLGIEAYSLLTQAINILHDIAAVAVMAFFFAAMSFGKQRQPKPQTVVSAATL